MALDNFEQGRLRSRPVEDEEKHRARLTVVSRMRSRCFPDAEIIDTLDMLGITPEANNVRE